MRHAIPLVLVSLASSAAVAADIVDTAQVVSATPIIDRVTDTRQDCSQASPPPAQPGVAAPIIGGVAGAILGNQVGRGSGRTAATVAGAIGGAIVGDHIGNRQARADAGAYGQGCRTIESTREVVNGYNVVYRYNGRDVSTVLPYNPGATLQVGVSVIQNAPVAGYAPPVTASVPPPPPGAVPVAAPPGTYRY